MNKNIKLQAIFNKKGKDALLSLVLAGKVSITEYESITSEQCEIGLDQLKDIIRETIREYKWTKSEQPFLYDGYLQENRSRDRDMMKDVMEALQLGVMTSIEWKLPDETRKTITDYNYFLQMRTVSSTIIQTCFGVEEAIVSEINTKTLEELKTYDCISRFDELFDAQVNTVSQS